MKTTSAGILLYKKSSNGLGVFLAHPGGPFFAKKDDGYWGIPKGRVEEGENAEQTAYREFNEEIGCEVPSGEALELTPILRKDGKTIYVWALEDTDDVDFIASNLCEVEWPPRTGKKIMVPEIDRAEWFPMDEARRKISQSQIPFLDELEQKLSV